MFPLFHSGKVCNWSPLPKVYIQHLRFWREGGHHCFLLYGWFLLISKLSTDKYASIRLAMSSYFSMRSCRSSFIFLFSFYLLCDGSPLIWDILSCCLPFSYSASLCFKVLFSFYKTSIFYAIRCNFSISTNLLFNALLPLSFIATSNSWTV